MGASMRPMAAEGAVSVDGVRLAVSDQGPKHARPLVLVHGWAASSAFFSPQVEGLCETHRVVCVDLRGHGRSAGGAPFTIDRLADDLAVVLRALEIRDALAVGWSMGALVLWRMMARSPEAAGRVAGLMVVDMSPKVRNDSDWTFGLRQDSGDALGMAESISQDWASAVAAFTPKVFAHNAADALLAWSESAFVLNDPSAMAAFWMSMMHADCRDAVRGLSTPTLVCHGALSRLYGEATAQWIAQNAPAAAAIRFDRSGHAPHLEEAARFNDLILHFTGALDIAEDPRDVIATVMATMHKSATIDKQI